MKLLRFLQLLWNNSLHNNKINPKVFEELCDAIGRENVFDNIEERVRYSFDTTKEKSIPDLVIRPHSTEQVSKCRINCK